MIDMHSTMQRRAARASVVLLGLGVGMFAVPAHADPPSTWESADNGSVLDNLLLLVGVPLLVIALLTLLVYLPSMVRGQSSEPALAFQDRPEWFGGPRKGVEATAGDAVVAEETKGGAGARW
jgi:hypothetical protein